MSFLTCFVGDKTKPKFLLQLIHFMQRELRLLGGENSATGDPRRLQVCREAFSCFIMEFKTYEKILTEIKNEYEFNFLKQRAQIEKLMTCESKASILDFQNSQKIEKVKLEWETATKDLKKENLDLKSKSEKDTNKINNLEEQIQLLNDEIFIQESAHAKEDFLRKRVLELQDYMEKEKQSYEMKMNEKYNIISELEEKIHIVCRENEELKNCVMKLENATENFVDRKIYKKLEVSYSDQKIILRENQEELKNLLRNDVSTVKKIEQVQEENQNANLQNCIISGKYFIGLGSTSEIPKVLRFKGKILNRKLTKMDTVSLIKEVWKSKSLQKGKTTDCVSLEEFLYIYLKKKFGSQERICEWAYNIFESARRYSFACVECLMFFNILSKKCNESVYHYVSFRTERLKESFLRTDAQLHNAKPVGYLKMEDIINVLKTFGKNSEEILELKQIIEIDQKESEINLVSYRWLFENNCGESMFVNVLLGQELNLMNNYLSGLTKVLKEGTGKLDNALISDITNIFIKYDTLKSLKEQNKYLERGFGVSNLIDLKVKEFSKALFLKNLSMGVVILGNHDELLKSENFQQFE
ncbi:Translin-associated factor X-interacting protein 1 [Clydaea vesicula]|uniref:Translin-associated factor X-interacting protein 1 n=1 Tax=Clydaea vesicula TaxID=447962 RepID=A0AAD5U0H2_9FUNG|nr:Translin-associated factor X-interacting protein 1 [Clydaea vesicula]